MASAKKFRAMLIQLSGKICSEELEKMKFALEEEISLSDLQSIQQPFELFRLMTNKNLLSADNCDRLASLFCDIGRIDLGDELLRIGGNMEGEGLLNDSVGYAGRLPCKTPHFYGRSKQVEEIVYVLGENNGSRLVIITGLPGYGKSCLAQKIGHTMVGRGFQVIFLCLREIKCVTKMAANILCYFNIMPGRKPGEQALSQLRSVRNKTILILDNAEDLLGLERGGVSQEFSAFVNHVAQYAGNVKCVIASRISFPACLQVPCHTVELLALENSEASKLLKDKSQGSCLTDSDAKSIAHGCLNIPLILHAAAALMTIVGPSELIQMLEAPLEVADMNQLSPDLKMRRFLNDCFQQLGTVLQEALISLAVFPAAFSHEQAMSVLSGLRHADTATSYQQKAAYLINLVTRSLVYSDRKSNQYFVHRVIQLFCEEKANEESRFRICYDKAREQFIAHCLNVVKKVQARFLSKEASKKAFCDYSCQERNIVQAMLWAANDRNTAIRCAKALNESVVFLAKVMKRIDFEEIYEAILTAFKDDTRLVADCLTCIGIKLIYSCECHRSCRNVSERSYRVLHRAKELYDGMGLTEGDLVAQCYSKIGRCMAQNGDLETALHLTDKALKIREKNQIEAPLKYAACCNDRAVVLSYLEKHQEALTLRENALAVYMEELNEHPFTATVYNFLGNDCLALHLPDRALEYFSSALRIREKFFGANHQETARTLHDIGLAWKRKGNFSEAFARLQTAVVTQDSVIDIPHEKLKSLELMTECCKNLNLPDEELQHLKNKILECQEEKSRAAELNNHRLENILRIANEVDMGLRYTAIELFP